MKMLFRLGLLLGCGLLLEGCADSCDGNIETTVLYAKPGPNSTGRSIYVNVVNKPELGIKKTLMYGGKEFGTFEEVVIINDPENRFASNRTICFTNYRALPAAAGGALEEEGIPRIQITD